MDNPQELKKQLLAQLAKKGDYQTILSHLSNEEEKKKETDKSERMTKLIEPLSEFAELMTANTKGVFMENFDKKLTKSTRDALAELANQVNGTVETLQEELNKTLSNTKSELTSEHMSRLAEAKTEIQDKLMQLAVEVVSNRANELFPQLSDEAKLTEEEIEDIINQSALSVESQINTIIGDYIQEYPIQAEQIQGLNEAIRKALPAERRITWDSIIGKPKDAVAPGGTSKYLVKKMIDEALANFTGGGGFDAYTNQGDFPATGSSDVLYLETSTGTLFRWTGSGYVEISAQLALGETSSTAYRGDRGATAFAHTSLTNNPHNVTKTQVGLGNVDDTSDANKPVSTATQTALDNKQNILSEGAFVNGDKTKLDGIEAEAEVNTINSDPTGVSGADQITNIISLTQAEYDAITPDAATAYYITDAA